MESQIIPALKAGFHLLSDRYFYSTIARDVVRGADPGWARKVYGFALKPDIVFYLKADLDSLLARVVDRGFDYWESGMDMGYADNLYDSFCIYQTKLMEQFDRMAEEFGFITIDATRSAKAVFEDIRGYIRKLMNES